MALISCPECSNQISDAAVSCPACGHPMQAIETKVSPPVEQPKVDKKELFQAGKSKFVLAEITAISQVKTRNWVWLVIGLPVVIGIIIAWMNLDGFIATGLTVAGLIILGFLYADEGKIATTGKVTEFDDDMEQVSNKFHKSVGKDNLIIYKSRNPFLEFNFSINPERVAEFKQESSYSHIWFYALGIIALIAANQLYIPLLYGVGAVMLVLGFLTRKAALEITGVGGAQVNLYTSPGDIKKVIEALTRSLENQEAA